MRRKAVAARLGVALATTLLATAGVQVRHEKAACACECVPTTPVEAEHDADVVFVGTVTQAPASIDPDDPGPVTYVFQVAQRIKGRATSPQAIQTSASLDACGIHFVKNHTYEVYAVESGGLFAISCGGTHEVAAPQVTPTATPKPRTVITHRPWPARR